MIDRESFSLILLLTIAPGIWSFLIKIREIVSRKNIIARRKFKEEDKKREEIRENIRIDSKKGSGFLW